MDKGPPPENRMAGERTALQAVVNAVVLLRALAVVEAVERAEEHDRVHHGL